MLIIAPVLLRLMNKVSRKDRPMISIILHIPVDAVESIKTIA